MIEIIDTIAATPFIATAVTKFIEKAVDLTVDGIKKVFADNGQEITDKQAQQIYNHYQQTNKQTIEQNTFNNNAMQVKTDGGNFIINNNFGNDSANQGNDTKKS